MAGAREIRQYLERFASQEPARFAVVKVGGAVLADDLPELASSLSFLYAVGLRPIIIHGAGPQIDAAIAAQGLTELSSYVMSTFIAASVLLLTTRRAAVRLALGAT